MDADESTLAPAPRSRPGGLSAGVWLPLLLVLYVLSPGPVVKLCGKNQTVINIVYAPLIYVDDCIPAVHRFYEWYGNLWGL